MNQIMGTRRQLLTAAAGLGLTGLAGPARGATELFSRAVAALEQQHGGRLGVALLDTASGALSGHRLDERFALCSTFKLLLAAEVLRQADLGRLRLNDWQAFGRTPWVPHAPVTQAHKKHGGMRLGELAEATQKTSDNMAANLLVRRLGGPAALTQALREQGDSVTRIDRFEPEMNRVPPGEVRDTTSPAAMARSAAHWVLGPVLQPASKERLQRWMKDTETGLDRLRAGLPEGWVVGDKTGTGLHPSMPDQINDVAVIWPPGRTPWVLSAYYAAPARGSDQIREDFEAVLAEVGRLAGRAIQGGAA